MEALAILVAASLNAATPLLLAAIGLLVTERSGVLNLGAEGMMLLAAVIGFAAGLHSGSVTVGLLAGTLAGLVAALVFAGLVMGLMANAYASGLALTLFGAGLSAFIGLPYVGLPLGLPAPAGLPWLADLPDLPFVGPAFFRLHPVVWLAFGLTAAVAWFLARTRAGLILRSIGDAPESAFAIGLPVRRVRLLATVFGGACCGLAGAYLSLVHTPLWTEGMVAGRGWIALALTSFATWRPWRLALGAWLFGSVTLVQFYVQGLGVPVASQWLAMLPYLATIVVLVLIARRPAFARAHMPASLGKPFEPS